MLRFFIFTISINTRNILWFKILIIFRRCTCPLFLNFRVLFMSFFLLPPLPLHLFFQRPLSHLSLLPPLLDISSSPSLPLPLPHQISRKFQSMFLLMFIELTRLQHPLRCNIINLLLSQTHTDILRFQISMDNLTYPMQIVQSYQTLLGYLTDYWQRSTFVVISLYYFKQIYS